MRSTILLSPAVLLLAACGIAPSGNPDTSSSAPTEPPMAARSAGMVRVTFPVPDPGFPGYLRLTPLYDQFFRSEGWLAIPIYRDPECIPEDFNLFQTFHLPDDSDPGAFGCPLLIHGSYLIEADAEQGTFPRIVNATGSSVPFWFVRWSEFQPLMADGRVTIVDIARLPSLLRGTATRFEEVLRPREGDHHVVINAQGLLEDGRRFQFHVTHSEDRTRSIRIAFR